MQKYEFCILTTGKMFDVINSEVNIIALSIKFILRLFYIICCYNFV